MMLSRIEINPYRRETMKALGNPEIMHAAIMGSFPSFGREDGRILWRIDTLGPSTYIIVQSRTKPDFSHMVDQFGWPESGQKWESLDYDRFLGGLEDGQVWRFRITANPVRSVPAEGAKRGKVCAHVTAEQQIGWLLQRCEKNGFRIPEVGGVPNVAVKDRGTMVFNRSGSRVSIGYATFEGVLMVADRKVLRERMISGIGRAKAYGCGLLTLARQS